MRNFSKKLAEARPAVPRWLIYAALFLLGCWIVSPLWTLPRQFESALEDGSRTYVSGGEMLLHRVASGSETATYHMPGSCVLAALLFNHLGLSFAAAGRLFRALTLVLAACVSAQFLAPSSLAAPLSLALLSGVDSGALASNAFLEAGLAVLLLLVAGLLVWRARKPSLARTAALSAVLGASLLYRSTLALFPLFLALYEGLVVYRGSWTRWWKHAALLCLAPFLFLAPWVRLNWLAFHRFIPFERGQASQNMIAGALGLVESTEGGSQWLFKGEPRGSAFVWAVGEISRHPLRYLGACAARAAYAFGLHPWLALAAAFSLWRYRRRRDLQPAALLTFYFVGVHCLMTVQRRYFDPFWPLCAVWAAALAGGALGDERAPGTGSFFSRAGAGVLFGAAAAWVGLALYAGGLTLAYAAVAANPGPASEELAFNRALARAPGDGWLLGERGGLRLERGEFYGAVDDLAQAAALEPEVERRRLDLAWARTLVGDEAPLLSWDFRSASPRGSAVAGEAHILIASVLLRRGQAREADGHLRAALEIQEMKGFSRAPFLTVLSDAFKSRPSIERVRLVEELDKLEPGMAERIAAGGAPPTGSPAEGAPAERDPAEEKRLLAVEQQRLGRFPRALVLFEELARANPDRGDSWTDLGLCRYLAGDQDGAVRDLRRAVAVDRRQFPAYLTLGAIFSAERRYDDALKIFDAGLAVPAVTPQDAEYRQTLAHDRAEALSSRARRP